MPMQYLISIFHGYKNDDFQLGAIYVCSLDEKLRYFLIFAQNIDCGYTLEPHWYWAMNFHHANMSSV